MITENIFISVVLALLSFGGMLIGGLASYAVKSLEKRLKSFDITVDNLSKNLEQFKMESSSDQKSADRTIVRLDTLLAERFNDIEELKEELIDMKRTFKIDLREAIDELKEIITQIIRH